MGVPIKKDPGSRAARSAHFCWGALLLLSACGNTEQTPSDDDSNRQGDSPEQTPDKITEGQETIELGPPLSDHPTEPCRRETFDVDEELFNATEYRYNTKGQLVEEYYLQAAVSEHLVLQNSYKYDAAGNQILISNHAPDGRVHSVTHQTFDGSGNLLSSALDTDADEVIDHSISYSYDESGNLLSDEGTGMGRDATWSIFYTYDESGNLLTELRNTDSIFATYSEYVYDEEGYLATKSTDRDEDGVFDEVIIEHHGEDDGTSEASRDEDVVYRIATYSYDEDGNQLEFSFDDFGDDIIDRTATSIWNNDGLLLTREYRYFNGSSVSDLRHTFTYDAQGREVTATSDSDIDGGIDFIYRTQYECEFEATDNGTAELR